MSSAHLHRPRVVHGRLPLPSCASLPLPCGRSRPSDEWVNFLRHVTTLLLSISGRSTIEYEQSVHEQNTRSLEIRFQLATSPRSITHPQGNGGCRTAVLGRTTAPGAPTREAVESGLSTISFETRLTSQRAIEEVYWKHRIWPAENPKPKPPLEAVHALENLILRARVEDSLRLSNALEAYWGQAITGPQVQAEIERQARDSKQPEVLLELWAALHNDPHLIAEILARPPLAERLARNWYETAKGAKNFGDRSFDAWWRSVSADLPVTLNAPAYNYTLPEIATSPQAQNRWSPTHACRKPIRKTRECGLVRR